jgi:hypothetical protein
MLLIDGVKYKLWVPKTEDDLERVVREHAKDIFGDDSLYLDLKQKLRSKAGVGSIPDGYVITFEEKPRWHVVEIELSSHPLYEHIVPQITKFINGIANSDSQKMLIAAMYEEISKDEVRKAWIKNKIGSEEIHKFLSSLISNSPVITIIIEEKTRELEEVCHGLPGEKKIVEFKTFEREGVGLGVHAHLFEPVVKVSPPPPPPPSPVPTPPSAGKLEVMVQNPSFIKYHLFYVKGSRRFFPGFKIPFKLETDIGEVETYVSSDRAGTPVGDPDAGTYIQANLAEWYRRHPTIKVGDKVIFETIEPGKKYRLSMP